MDTPNRTDKDNSNSVAIIAASNVDGYLRNASKRLRIPDQKGGRGTRRKLAMVTSVVSAEQTCETDIVDDDWDEVALPATSLAKKDPVKVDVDLSSTAVKPEIKLPILKDEVTAPAEVTNDAFVKKETIMVEDDLASRSHDGQDSFVIQGSKKPLIEQPQRAWRRSDPTYEAMIEQRDLLSAQRRSERIRRTSEFVLNLLAVLIRGRLLWRESRHLGLLKALLSLKFRNKDQNSDLQGEIAIYHSEREANLVSESFGKHFPFIAAIRTVKKIILDSKAPHLCKTSLAPTWVTLNKDTVNNKTSEAVRVLLKVIHDYFELKPKTVAPDQVLESASANPSTETIKGGKISEDMFADWSAPIVPGFLYKKIRQMRRGIMKNGSKRVPLPHPLYFSVLFISLAAAAGLQCRLVIAKRFEKVSKQLDTDANQNQTTETKLEKISIFSKKNLKGDQANKTGGRDAMLSSKKLPISCFWVEVWSEERQCFFAVNPCGECTTLWGAPYTFSVGGDVIIDATPRYISKYSSAYAFNQRLNRSRQMAFLWKNKLNWDDNREISEILLASFCKDMTPITRRQVVREKKQLDSLAYSEAIPTTLTALHRHPLFVIESDLARHEGVYPKDDTTILGSVKGHVVYKRSAVVSLRSRDGWLREGRSLISEDLQPYKVMPPPPSRPFAAKSMFYGIWQTKPFEPLPLRADGSIPHHRQTSWYILLDSPPPAGIARLTQPQIARVARRMQLDFGLAVTGFIRRRVDERRRGNWEVVIDGIVVREIDQARLVSAYEEWVQLVQEQEAAKRRNRAFSWWLSFSQRLLSTDRLRNQYLTGLSFGSMLTH
ncbi:unnamed protein product [Phytomonas sp. EM1]|nr:unnamed protein product [Phytomonas sp. EM1]|eukprot:CCW62179.1 unnamed protein product [Phytomonas sp. isolate EM1]